MRWLIRQWHRVQLARELLEQYEYDEAHRLPWDEVARRLEAYGGMEWRTHTSGAAEWRRAIEGRASEYQRG